MPGRTRIHKLLIVSAGGLSLDGTRWILGNTRYLFPVAVLSALFRGLFLDGLKKLVERDQVRLDGQDFPSLLDALYRESWVVYAKRPFGGPEQVFRYLGRYTHRVGISNQRLIFMDEQGVCFASKNGKQLTLPPQEFIRRFLLHVLPGGFHRIRHYGLLANGSRRAPLLYQPGTTQYTKLLKQQRILPGNSMPALRDRYFARYQSGGQGPVFYQSHLHRCLAVT